MWVQDRVSWKTSPNTIPWTAGLVWLFEGMGIEDRVVEHGLGRTA